MSPERSWMVLLLVLGVGVPMGTWLAVPDARKYAVEGDEKAASPRAKSTRADTSAGKDKKQQKKKADAHEGDPGDDADEAALEALFKRAEKEASFLFATFPDPRENVSPRGFDEQLAALRRALETAGYSKFDSWDPWFGASADPETRPWRALPGLMFFRRDNDRPLGIFIVGETPTRGIHEQALLKALALWGRPPENEATRPRAKETLRILGPSSSGATRSLADTLAAWKAHKDNAWFEGAIRAVSGSATSGSNADLMRAAGIEFDATVHDDDTLKAFVSRYLDGQLGIGDGEIAILTESSSAYGQHLARSEDTQQAAQMAAPEETAPTVQPASGGPLVLRYPPYLRSLRQSYARARGSKPPPPGAQSLLEIESDDDLAAALFEPHAAPSRAMAELSLNRVIEAIAAERIRAVEIAALDPQDAAFLAMRVKESFPAVTIVILSSDVLYLHRDYEVIDGLLIASTYPLANRSQRITYPFNGLRARHSFPSEQAEGTFNATLLLAGFPNLLVDYGPPLRVQPNGQTPALWMSVVSKGEIWPVDARTREDLVLGHRLEPAANSYVHVVGDKQAKEAKAAVPPDAWRASRGVGFYAFVSLFAILSLICLGCYAWAQWLGKDARDAPAPLLVRALGNLPHHQYEAHRRSFMFVLLLVLAVLWSFVAVVQRGAVHRPTDSLLIAPVIRTAGWLVGMTQFLVLATLVYAAFRIPSRSRVVAWLRAKLPHNSFLKRVQQDDQLPRSVRVLQLLVSAAAAGVMVISTDRSLDGWLEHCGFPHNLVGPAVDQRCQRFVLFMDRARALNSGVSLIATLFVLALGYFAWYGSHLYKAWHTDGFRQLRTQDLFPAKAPPHLASINKAAKTAYGHFESVWPSFGIALAMVGFLVMAYLRASQLPFFESGFYLKSIAAVYALFLMLLVYGCGRALELWWEFRALLQGIATVPRMQSTGDGTNDLLTYVGAPWDWRVARAWRNVAAGLPGDVHATVAAAFDANGNIDSEGWSALLQREEKVISDPAASDGDKDAWATIRALRLWAVVNYLRQHLLNVLRATSAGLLLLLVVVSMYPFRGERLLLGVVLALGLITTTTVFLIFVQLDNDYVMARLGRQKPDRSWSPAFIRGLVLHAGLPLLGIMSLRFPEVGGLLSSLSGPLAALLGK